MDVPLEIVAGAVGAVVTGVCWFLKYKITRLDRLSDEHTKSEIELKERVSRLEGTAVPREEYDKFAQETTKNVTDLHWRFRSIRDTLNIIGIDFTSNRKFGGSNKVEYIDPPYAGDRHEEE